MGEKDSGENVLMPYYWDLTEDLWDKNWVISHISDESIRVWKIEERTKAVFAEILWNNSSHLSDNFGNNSCDIAKLAKELLEKYQLDTFWTKEDINYLTKVITIKDFQENPEKYIHKLTKWIWSFPLGLNLKTFNNFLNIGLWFDTNWFIEFQHRKLLPNNNLLTNALALALKNINASQASTNGYIKMDVFNFLKNFNKIQELISDFSESQKEIDESMALLKTYKCIVLSVLDIVLNTRIIDPTELLNKKPEWLWIKTIENVNNPYLVFNDENKDNINYLQEYLLENVNWVVQSDINTILPIQNFGQFYTLIDEIVRYIINSDKYCFLWNEKKNLDEYNIEELVAFACYITRNIIEKYWDTESMVKNAISWFSYSNITWKCTDFTWLTLQIINNYFRKKYPEKFEGLKIWFDNQIIWDYAHCYVKIYRRNKDGMTDVCFLDPTKLANEWLKALKNPKRVFEVADASNLPIEINRSAENLLVAFKNKQTKKGLLNQIDDINPRNNLMSYYEILAISSTEKIKSFMIIDTIKNKIGRFIGSFKKKESTSI